MRRIVIADAGPLIALARIDKLGLLHQLFGQVTLTTQIAQELLDDGPFPDTPTFEIALSQPWLQTVDVGNLLPDDWLDQCRDWMNLHQIDLGEASAMVLAQHSQSQGDSALLVLDDFRGRSAAQHAGFAIVGTTGLLLLAKQAGLVTTVKPLMLALRQSGYFLSDRLIEAALRQTGELAYCSAKTSATPAVTASIKADSSGAAAI